MTTVDLTVEDHKRVDRRSDVHADAPAPPASNQPSAAPRRWFGTARSARTRIVTSYVVLMAFSAVVSAVLTREVMLVRLESRIDADLRQEVLELERLLRDGRDPTTGERFASLPALFDIYFARNVPSNEEGVLTFVEGEPYRSSLVRFPLTEVPHAGTTKWAPLVESGAGDASSVGSYQTELGKASYRAHIVTLGSTTGAFVVTTLPAAELQEIANIRTYGLTASLAVLLFATAFAWPIAGRVLEPVRQLTETARSITESELNHRINIQTRGEAGEMARSFNAMLDRLQSVVRSQREFVSSAGHELRDPLTICRGHLELLDAGAVDAQSTLPLVLDELKRMGRIVDDLQVFADAEQPDFLRPENVDLRLLAHELVAKASVMGQRTWVLDAAADGTAVADRHRITEAVMNLAHNAVMHTAPGGIVAIGTSRSGAQWRIWVRDTGVGMPVDDEARLFQRFTRGPEARRRYQGAGLGLAIVKLVAEAHDGHVVIDSSPGRGATVTLVMATDPNRQEPA